MNGDGSSPSPSSSYSGSVSWMSDTSLLMTNRQKLFANANINMIPIKADMSHLFEINAALANGETVSIPADRIWGAHKYVSKTFLGKEAHLPSGPFQVVTSRQLEALVVHVMKVKMPTASSYISPRASVFRRPGHPRRMSAAN